MFLHVVEIFYQQTSPKQGRRSYPPVWYLVSHNGKRLDQSTCVKGHRAVPPIGAIPDGLLLKGFDSSRHVSLKESVNLEDSSQALL